MVSTGGVSAFAGIAALVIGLLLLWWKDLPKVAVVMFLVAGAGLAGWAGDFLQSAAGYVRGFVDQLTSVALGAPAGALIVLVLVAIVVHDLWPRKKARGLTIGAAFALPFFAIAGGGVVATLMLAVAGLIGSALAALVVAA